MLNLKNLSAEDYAAIVSTAVKLGYTQDQIDMALMTTTDAEGNDTTPQESKILLAGIENALEQK